MAIISTGQFTITDLNDGADGTSVSSIIEEYYLSTSKTTQTGGSWVTTPPAWTTGTYLWTRTKITYINPSSTAYTTPVCDSSWEAVKGVETRLTTAEQKITNSAIINVVKNSVETDGTKTFAQTSTVKQTAENVSYNFMSTSGGYNIVRNGGFKNGSNGWVAGEYNPNGTNRKFDILGSSNEWVLDGTYALCMESTNNTVGEYRIDSSKFPVKKNTKYTLSYLVAAHRVTEIGHYIRGNEWDIINSKTYLPKNGGKDPSNWTRIVTTFNTGRNYQISLNFVHFKTLNNSYSWITDVIINEGDVPLPWCPHPDEVYSGSTIIDGSGVTIKNGAIKIQNNSGQNVMSGDQNGNLLIDSGTFKIQNKRGGVLDTIDFSGGTMGPIMTFSNGIGGSSASIGLNLDSPNILNIYTEGLSFSSVDPNGARVGGIKSISIVEECRASYFTATSNGVGSNFKVGDDAWIGDINMPNTISIKGVANIAAGYIKFGNGARIGHSGNSAWPGLDVEGSASFANLLEARGGISSLMEAKFATAGSAYADPLSGTACAIKASGRIACNIVHAQSYRFVETDAQITSRSAAGGGFDFWGTGTGGSRFTFDGTNMKLYKVVNGTWTVLAG